MLLILAISFLSGLVSTWIFRQLAWKFNIVNTPSGLVVQHTKPIAYLGGLGVYFGMVISIVIFNFLNGTEIPLYFLLFGLLFTTLGLVDDLVVFSPLVKFSIQVIVAVFTVKYSVCYAFTGIQFLDYALSAFWILVLINAFNVTDVCDGLLSGLGLVAFLLAALAFGDGNSFLLVAAGSTLGFLIFNFPPASIFLGDAGSHLMGYIAAYFTLSNQSLLPDHLSFYILAALCIIPIFEMTFLVVVRTMKGIAWYRGSKDHFALRLQSIGYSKTNTDLLAWSIGILGGLPLFYVIANDGFQYPVLIGIYLFLIVLMLLFWWYLLKIKVE